MHHRPFLGFATIVVLLANCATSTLALTKIRQGGFAFALHMATTK
jgi:hypothetical protein